MPGPTDRIDDVLASLDEVVTDAVERRSRVGYFAAVYRTVTAAIRQGIEEGLFDDPAHMERLEEVFAQRYLDALAAHGERLPTSRSWQVVLDAARRWRFLVLQHVLAGTNAHVNLDLGVAVATTTPAGDLPGLRRDFDRLNEILASHVDIVQAALNRISPWLEFLDLVGGSSDEQLLHFSLAQARQGAWWFATELAALPREAWRAPVRNRDLVTTGLGHGVLKPGLLQPALLAIRARERDDVAGNIRLLANLPAPSLEVVDRRVRGGEENEAEA